MATISRASSSEAGNDASAAYFDTESIFSVQSCSSSSDDESQSTDGEFTSAFVPSPAFERLKSLLQQRDKQLTADQLTEADEQAALVGVKSGQADVLQEQLTQSGPPSPHHWSIPVGDSTRQDTEPHVTAAPTSPDSSAPHPTKRQSVSPIQPSLPTENLFMPAVKLGIVKPAAEAELSGIFAESDTTIPASAVQLLQMQAKEAEEREAHRLEKQQRVAALQQHLARQHCAAGCIQSAWRAYLLSPGRALRLRAILTVQAAVRGHAARRHVAHLHQVAAAEAGMKLALASGSRTKVEAAALQLRQAGAAEQADKDSARFEQDCHAASSQLSHASQFEDYSAFEAKLEQAKRFEHLQGEAAAACAKFEMRQREAEAVIMTALRDASLNRVQSLIAKASLLGVDQQRLAQARQACISRNEAATIALQLAVDAQPFSADIFRVRSLDAKRLGLNSEADSAQGELDQRRQAFANQLQQSTTGATAAQVTEMCIQARRLGLSGEAVAAEQILSERQAQASQQLTGAAACSSAVQYTAAVATAQAAAVHATVISHAAEIFSARCKAAAVALVTAATDGSWSDFEARRRQATALGQVKTGAEAQMQTRRNAASEAVSGALQLVLSELDVGDRDSSDVRAGHQGRPQSAMHCTDCSNSFQSVQVRSVGQEPVSNAGSIKGSTQSMWAMSEKQTPLDELHEQVKRLTAEMVAALPSSDSSDAAWWHAESALTEVLHVTQCRHINETRSPLECRSCDSPSRLSAALCNARHVGLLQTVQLALQILQKHIEMAQQAQQTVVKFKLPTAQHVQDCTLAWQQSTALASSLGASPSTKVPAGQLQQTAAQKQSATLASDSVALPIRQPQAVPGHQDCARVGSSDEAMQRLVQQLCQGVVQQQQRLTLAEWVQHCSSCSTASPVDATSICADFSLEQLTDMRDLLSSCDGLPSLTATGNMLINLQGVVGCTSLTHLRLNQNRHTSLDGLHRLHMLRELYLADNHLTTFPDLAPLSQLHTLDLARNHLTSLGSNHTTSPNLCYLDLSHNQLTILTQLGQLPQLRELIVADNQLQNLDGLSGCPLLMLLAAQHNRIAELPAVLDCAMLRMLHLGGNRIKTLLHTPWLPHLLHLKLQDNLITHVGPLPHLTLLQTLDLSFNHIQEFSVIQGLSTFQQLQFLRVNDNPVQHEPNFFFSLQRLLPWTQHEFGHARHYPSDQQITLIQQQAVLGHPQVVQMCRESQWQPHAGCVDGAVSAGLIRDCFKSTASGDGLVSSSTSLAAEVEQQQKWRLLHAAAHCRQQGEDSWDKQTMCDLVQRQSMLLGHLLHLVHSRPAFPLSQTADAFWDKLAGVLQSSQHVQAAERQLLRLLAGDAQLRSAVVDSQEFATLARAWDVRFRSQLYGELHQPVVAHQNKVERCPVYAQQQEASQAAGAVKIQTAWRGRMARKSAAALRQLKAQISQCSVAAVHIQAVWRGYWVRRQALLHCKRMAAATQLAQQHAAAVCIQAVARGRRVRRRLAQAQAAAKLPDSLSRPFTPDPDFDLDAMQDFLDTLPDPDPLPPTAPVLASTFPADITLHSHHAVNALFQTVPGALPRVTPSSLANAAQTQASNAQALSSTASLATASSIYQQPGRPSHALSAGLPTSSPAVLPSMLAAPTVAQAFAHSPALAKRFHAMQKQQPGKSSTTASQSTFSSSSFKPAADVGSPGAPQDQTTQVGTGAWSQDSERRHTHSSASPSGRASTDWLAAGVAAPAFTLPEAVVSRSAQRAQHSQLQTILEGGVVIDGHPAQQQEMSLPRIGSAQHAQHTHHIQTAASDAHTLTSPASPSRQPLFAVQLPVLKAASPPLGLHTGPRRVNSDLAHARPPQPHRTASDIHTGHNVRQEASTGHSEHEAGERGWDRGSFQGSGPQSASSLQSEQSRSSQASYKAAVKEQRHKAVIEQLMQEWRIGDFAVAESIFKSRQRQLKQKGGAQMRQKMQDPEARLARLKSQLGEQIELKQGFRRNGPTRPPIHMPQAAIQASSLISGGGSSNVDSEHPAG